MKTMLQLVSRKLEMSEAGEILDTGTAHLFTPQLYFTSRFAPYIELLKGSVARDFRLLVFFLHPNPSEPLTHILKYF